MHPHLTHQLATLHQDDLRRAAAAAWRAGETAAAPPVPLRMRKLGPADRDRVEEGFNHLSAASIRARFHGPVKPSPTLFAWVDELDGRDRIAVGASHAASGAPLGLARYVRDSDDPSRAEFAITVVDAWQRRGVGSALAEELARQAADVGVTTFTATCQVENHGARAVARKLGDACFGRPSRGIVTLAARLAPPCRQDLREGRAAS